MCILTGNTEHGLIQRCDGQSPPKKSNLCSAILPCDVSITLKVIKWSKDIQWGKWQNYPPILKEAAGRSKPKTKNWSEGGWTRSVNHAETQCPFLNGPIHILQSPYGRYVYWQQMYTWNSVPRLCGYSVQIRRTVVHKEKRLKLPRCKIFPI